MGGYGSGKHGTRATVGDCLTVDANVLARQGSFKQVVQWSTIRWTRGGNEIGTCGILTRIGDDWAVCTFQYNDREAPVSLSWYAPGFGGRRYLFLCPACGRRMRTIHFKGEEIACRLCHNLTYESCNENHHFDSFFKTMAIGLKAPWQDVKRYISMMKRAVRREPKRPRGRPRKETL